MFVSEFSEQCRVQIETSRISGLDMSARFNTTGDILLSVIFFF